MIEERRRSWRAFRSIVVVATLTVVLAPSPAPLRAQTVHRCGSSLATIVGTEGDDLIRGTSGADVIVGLGGNDLIDGEGGHDIICGGRGRDHLIGGRGRDRIDGGPGRDRLVGKVGNDRLIGGPGADTINGGAGRDRIRGSGGFDTCTPEIRRSDCERLQSFVPSSPIPTVDRVIHISFDGLRADHVTPTRTPDLSEFLERAAFTLNARTDPARTQTLPNHTSQFTGLAVVGGHNVTYNADMGRTVHNEAGRYVPSVFDVVHDNGGLTAMYVGKSKFDVIDRTWNGVNGAPDSTGAPNGRDKIDYFVELLPEDAVGLAFRELQRTPDLEFVFFHLRNPDLAGHATSWDSSGYRDGVLAADRLFGELLAAIDADPEFASSTAIIVSSDHGGPSGEKSHNDETRPDNYIVPLVVWAPGVAAGRDLYDLNVGRRIDPAGRQLPTTGAQPIRTGEIANLALDLLGYGPISGSTLNARQDLRLK